MKIWCDVCSQNKASVFCSADEAALCDDCDSRVHQANKLASKHKRFSLLQPSSGHAPLCDICQEKKALLFCQQDRAILCKDCDVPIHSANDLTRKHSRFLLTGVKLSGFSATAAAATESSATSVKSDSESSGGYGSVPDFRPPMGEASRHLPNFKAQSTTLSHPHDVNHQLTNNINMNINGGGCCSTTSSISEYLIDILPGWQVDDLLDSSSDLNALFKGCENDRLLVDPTVDSKINSYENMGLWVPQTPYVPQPSTFSSGIYGLQMEKGDMARKVSRRRMDDGFTVPEMTQHFAASKRSRTFF